jgi:hypothetical protein
MRERGLGIGPGEFIIPSKLTVGRTVVQPYRSRRSPRFLGGLA